MMEEIHIADGIVVKLLLAGIVLASGVVGALGLAPVASQAATDGLADDPSPALMFPINNVTVGLGSQQLSLDGKGNDPYPTASLIGNVAAAFPINNVTMAFPINNVSASGGPWDVKDTDHVGGSKVGSTVVTAHALTGILPQDMDPY